MGEDGVAARGRLGTAGDGLPRRVEEPDAGVDATVGTGEVNGEDAVAGRGNGEAVVIPVGGGEERSADRLAETYFCSNNPGRPAHQSINGAKTGECLGGFCITLFAGGTSRLARAQDPE